MKHKTWLITGTSKGMGLSLTKSLVKMGYNVAATTRNRSNVIREIGEADNLLVIEADITKEDEVKLVVSETLNKFHSIDVLVNNAGYGQLGTIEELSLDEIKKNFDVNIFASFNLIKYILPTFRKQESGYIINISSIAGFTGGFPGWGAYNASKFALTGLTEALAAEVNEFGIKATVVYPGYFRTAFLSDSSLRLPEHPIKEYTAARELERVHKQNIPGSQIGDPDRVIDLFLALVSSNEPPLHFWMGSDAMTMAEQQVVKLQKELKNGKVLSVITDFKKDN